MNKQTHNTIHSLVPVYACLSRIQKLSVEGFQTAKADLFIDIRKECEDAMGELCMLEKELIHPSNRRRSYETKKGE